MAAPDDEDPNYWADYESGPYCRHWREPGDCVRVCAKCGVECWQHVWDVDDHEWVEADT